MRYILILTLALVAVSPSEAWAQDRDENPSWYVSGGMGAFVPESSNNLGYAVTFSVARDVSNGFRGVVSLGIAHVHDQFGERDPLFAGDRQFTTYYIFRAGFEYPLQLSERQSLSLGTGFVYERSYSTRPVGTLARDRDGNIVGISGFSVQEMTPNYGGLYLTARYGYDFSPLEVGLRVDTHLLYYDGGGEFIVGPFVAIRI